MSEELEDYRNLVKSGGYLRLKDAILGRLQTEAQTWTKSAIGDTDDRNALNRLRQVTASISAIEMVFAYPENRIKELEGAQARENTPAGYSRRGRL